MSSKKIFFDSFRDQCTAISKELMPNSGLIYELYQRRLSAGIDRLLRDIPVEFQDDAKAMAREEFDYMTAEEIADEIRQDRDNGICCHGIDRDCCPMGCGDLDD